MGSFDVSLPLLLLGTIFGMGYGLLGIGLVLAYRSSGFINFAHGSVGLIVAAMMAVVVNGYGVPYWLGFVGAVIAAALLSAGLEAFVVRKLAHAPRVLSMVATLGVAEALLLLALSFSKGGLGGGRFPQPPGFPRFDLTVFVSPSASALLILSPVVVAALSIFWMRSRYGLAIRGAAANPDSATLAGVDPRHMAMLSWALAGALAAFAAMLIIPNQSTVTADALGPDFIIRGLAVAAVAGFANLPLALGAGLGIGLIEQILATNTEATGWFEVVLFGLILVGVARRGRLGAIATESWAVLAPDRRLPDAYRDVWLIRNLGGVIGAVALAVAALAPLWITNRSAFVLSTIAAFAVIGISVSFLTGVAGQLSLGQVAFAAIGAVAGVRVATGTGSMVLGLLAGGAVGAATSAVVGWPAMRIKGVLPAVATLAFALATFSWLLREDWAFGTGLSSRPVSIVGIDLLTSRAFYYVGLTVLAGVLAGAGLLRRSSFGRSLVAVRDNEAASRVLQISPRGLLLRAYGVAGFVAGVGGVVLAMSNTFVSRSIFTPSDSINVVSLAVIGGLSELTGPLLGAAYLIGAREFFDLELSALAGLNAAWLILILEQPRGIHGLLASTRRNVIDQIARWRGVDPAAAAPTAQGPSDQPMLLPVATRTDSGRPEVTEQQPHEPVLLDVRGLTKRFGDLVAVNEVSFRVEPGETLGLIGPNGAGKTTLFELVSGYLRPDAGTVAFAGADVTRLAPEARSRRGMVRSFQNASLFPTLSPRDVLGLAYQRAAGRSLVLAGSSVERRIEAEARQGLVAFGLQEVADQPISTLSTGTRRIVELAANVALRPRLLLLDEPSAGLAQAETEALAEVIAGLREAHGITLVVIEHDMPLLASVCNRMIALEVGEVIAEGTPAEVQAHPAVVRSYLGDDPAAIARSGTAPQSP